MSFDTLELSDHDGSPIELYLFESDDLLFRWAYCTDSEIRNVGLYTYIPEAISRTELRQNAGEAGAEHLTITIPWNNPVAVLHVPYLPPRPMRVTIFKVQRRGLMTEIVQAFIGYVSSFAQKGPLAELTCSQIIDSMQQTVPWAVFKSGCLWTTYELGCGVSRAAFITVVNDIFSINGAVIHAPSINAMGANWFTAGIAENPATGEARFITSHVGDAITLVHAFTAIDTGTVLNLYAGDDHQPETCRLKFNNKVNYVGFDFFSDYNVFVEGTT